MARHWQTRIAALAVAAMVSTACGGGNDGELDPAAPGDDPIDNTSEEPPDDEEPAPTETILDNDDNDVVPIEADPADQADLRTDLLELVLEGVDAGTWTEAEGITLALDGFTGHGDPVPGLEAMNVIEPGLTALLRQGADLLDGDTLSDTEATELRAALAFFSPTQEVLDAISSPAPTRSSGGDDEDALGVPGTGGIGLIAVAPIRPALRSAARGAASASFTVEAQEVGPQCAGLVADGFSASVGAGADCYLYEETITAGNRLRVYYPSPWAVDEARQALIAVTMDALVKSTTVYAELATVGDVNAVFSMANSSAGTANAAQSYFDLSKACPVTIYPLGTGQATGDYQQTIAHETFHCVQDRSFTTAPYGTHKWWLEGSAVYFGNVVYPENNKEHRRTARFDRNSLTRNPTLMSYENTVFFQYFANRRGAAGVISLLRSVAENGATLDSLASTDGMGELWQDFVVAFVADAVLDTGGGTVGPGDERNRTVTVGDVTQVNLEAPQMVATRYLVEFAEEKRFVQDHSEDPLHAAVEEDKRANLGAWTKLPDEIRSECDRELTYVVVTTAADRDLTFVVDVSEVEKAECDPCLLGPWDLQLSSFETFMGRVFASTGGSGATISIGGHYYFEFNAQGGLDAIRRNMTIQVTIGGFTAPGFAVSGVDTGRYTTDGETLTVSGLSGFAETSVGDGAPISSIIDPNGGAGEYECDKDGLTINDASYGPLVFDRIDEIPEPEPVTVDTGDTNG